MNGQTKKNLGNGLVICIASLIIGGIIGDLAGNKEHRKKVLDAVDKAYVAVKDLGKPKE